MLASTLTLDPNHVIGPVNRRLFGGFVEHMGRRIYMGISEPTHPTFYLVLEANETIRQAIFEPVAVSIEAAVLAARQ